MCTSSFPANLSRRVCVRGRTQVEAGSRTVLGIGPGVSVSHEYEILPLTLSPPPAAPIELVNQVTGHLRLL